MADLPYQAEYSEARSERIGSRVNIATIRLSLPFRGLLLVTSTRPRYDQHVLHDRTRQSRPAGDIKESGAVP
jgi:hypothetical protein